MDSPPFFYGGGVSPKICVIFQKKKSSFPPFVAKKKILSHQAKIQKKSKLKNSSIFELPDPKIGG